MQKKPFLLLEVALALTFALVCITPLIERPLGLYRAQLKQLQKMEKERLADWTFSEVKELLLKNEIPWSKIPDKREEPRFSLKNGSLEIPGAKPKSIERSFALKKKGAKTGLEGQDYRFLKVTIYLDKDPYEFSLIVQKNSA